MTENEFKNILLYILDKAGKPLHLAILLRIIKDCKPCEDSYLKPFAMSDGKKSMYIPIIKGFNPDNEMNSRYPSFYDGFEYDDNTMFVSSSKKPDLSYFSESQTECLDQSIAANKDKVYIPSNSSNCDCLDW